MKFSTGKEGWVGRLEKIIKNQFKDVGKGWFNINESSKETYEFGKLKKFLTLVNFMMQDTVLNLSKKSVDEFVTFIMSYIPDETFITNTAKVENKFHDRKVEIADDESDGDIKISENELIGCKETKIWLNS